MTEQPSEGRPLLTATRPIALVAAALGAMIAGRAIRGGADPGATLLPAVAVIAVAFAAILFDRDAMRRAYGRLQPRHLASGVIGGVLLFVLSSAAYTLNLDVLGLEAPAETALFGSGGMVAFAALAMAAMMAVIEENLFRGLLLGWLDERLPALAAALASAALFAAYHLSLFQLLPTFLLGLGLAWLTLRSASLWPATIAHVLFNLTGFGLGLVMAGQGMATG